MSLLQNIESVNSAVATQALLALEVLYAVDAILVRPLVSVEESVYGVAGADDDHTVLGSVKVILTESTFAEAGPQVFGFTEGQTIYSRDASIQAGDKLEIGRQDDKPLHLKVIKSKGLGLTKVVMYQLEVSNVGIE